MNSERPMATAGSDARTILLIATAHGLASIVLRFVFLAANVDGCPAANNPWLPAALWTLYGSALLSLAIGLKFKQCAEVSWSVIATFFSLSALGVAAVERAAIYASGGTPACGGAERPVVLWVTSSDAHFGVAAILLGAALGRLAAGLAASDERHGAVLPWFVAAPMLLCGVGCLLLVVDSPLFDPSHWPLGSYPECHGSVRYARRGSLLEDLVMASMLLSCGGLALRRLRLTGVSARGTTLWFTLVVTGYMLVSGYFDQVGRFEAACQSGRPVASLIDPALDVSRQSDRRFELCDESPHLLKMAEDLGHLAVLQVDARGAPLEPADDCLEDRRPCTLVLIADDRAPVAEIRGLVAASFAAGYESVQFVSADELTARHPYLRSRRLTRACVCRWTTSEAALALLAGPATTWAAALGGVCSVPKFPREILQQ